MKNRTKQIIIVVASLALVILAASFIYAKFINKADAEFDSNDVRDRLTTTIAGDPAQLPEGDGVDGIWVIADGSEVGYRVDESINGFDSTANGRTNVVTGEFTIVGTEVTAGDFTVDMTTFSSDKSKRDSQFNGRIMAVGTFPTATFVLSGPISFGDVPTDGSTIRATAIGDLTLRGATKSVTFEVEATFQSGRVGVLGQIPVVFADFGIPNPSFATVTTEDNGLLEFVLIFDRA